jgi:hypothetical protein
LLCKASWLDKRNGTHFDDRHPAPPSKLPLLIIIGFAVAGAVVTAVPFSLGWRRARKRREAKTGRAVFFDASGSAGHPRNLKGSFDVS